MKTFVLAWCLHGKRHSADDDDDTVDFVGFRGLCCSRQDVDRVKARNLSDVGEVFVKYTGIWAGMSWNPARERSWCAL